MPRLTPGLALIPATATAAGDLLVRRALLVTKARALLGLGQIAEAAALVTTTAVPNTFTYDITFAHELGRQHALESAIQPASLYGR